MRTLNNLLLLTLVSLTWCCTDHPNPYNPDSDDGTGNSTDVTVEYSEDDTDIPNPDRGFYRYSETRASEYNLLNEEELKGYRNPGTAGMADTDLHNLHYTYLNSAYNNEVNNDWVDGGCIEDIKKNLGYRFVLKKETFPTAIAEDGILKVVIELQNEGYTSSMQNRKVNLILRNADSGEIISLPFNTDTRFWFSEVTLDQSFSLPPSLTKGEYGVLLQIADTNESLADRPEYSVRFANTDMWEEETGYNDLNHTVTVK